MQIERIETRLEIGKHAFPALILVMILTGCRGEIPASIAAQPSLEIEPTLSATTPSATSELAFYLLPSAPVELLTATPLPAEKACSGTPILRLADIEGFVWEQQVLILAPEAARRLVQMEPRIIAEAGIAFALCVNRNTVYTGAFWSAMSSVPHPGVVIDVYPARGGLAVPIQLGYPEGLYEDLVDLRFDARIHDALVNADILEQVD